LKNKKEAMILYDPHQEFSAKEFLSQYHEYSLYDVLHQIKALLLYPLNCQCKDTCRCEKLRASIRLALNINLYNQAEARQERREVLSAMQLMFKIPEDRFFRTHYGEGYPLWLIEKSFDEKVTHFKIVGQLVWTLLRLAKTYEVSILRNSQASLKEAIEIIVGKMPLKSKPGEQIPYLCGEKGYAAHFKTYKSVCHFITALQLLDKESFTLADSGQITEFLSLSHWIRKKLLAIETPNVKGKVLLTADTLMPLPPWVNSESVRVSLKPFEHKLQELEVLVERSIASHPS